jgi:uncharacterized protein (DUF983 family)
VHLKTRPTHYFPNLSLATETRTREYLLFCAICHYGSFYPRCSLTTLDALRTCDTRATKQTVGFLPSGLVVVVVGALVPIPPISFARHGSHFWSLWPVLFHVSLTILFKDILYLFGLHRVLAVNTHVLIESFAPTHIARLRSMFVEGVGISTWFMLGRAIIPVVHDLVPEFSLRWISVGTGSALAYKLVGLITESAQILATLLASPFWFFRGGIIEPWALCCRFF